MKSQREKGLKAFAFTASVNHRWLGKLRILRIVCNSGRAGRYPGYMRIVTPHCIVNLRMSAAYGTYRTSHLALLLSAPPF